MCVAFWQFCWHYFRICRSVSLQREGLLAQPGGFLRGCHHWAGSQEWGRSTALPTFYKEWVSRLVNEKMPSWCTLFLLEYLLFLQCAGRLPFLAVAVANLDPTGDRIPSVSEQKSFVWENENSRTILFRIGSGPFKCRIRTRSIFRKSRSFKYFCINLFVFVAKGRGHVQEGEQRWVGMARPASHVPEVATLLHIRQ